MPTRNRNIVLLTVWGAVFVSSQFALLAFLALDLHQRARRTLAVGSLFVVVAQAGGLAGRIGWGSSATGCSRGRKPLLHVVTNVALGAVLLLAALPASAPPAAIVAVVALADVGLIGFQGLWITLVAESAHSARVGAATGAATAGPLLAAGAAVPLLVLFADLSGSQSHHLVCARSGVILRPLPCVCASRPGEKDVATSWSPRFPRPDSLQGFCPHDRPAQIVSRCGLTVRILVRCGA